MKELPEIVRWNDDNAITHDRLRMRNTNLSKNLTKQNLRSEPVITVCTHLRKEPRHPLNRGLGGPQSPSGRCGVVPFRDSKNGSSRP
jgi:hypothetical protein